jgi:endonuclease-8
MPEGDTVHKLATAMASVLEGQTIREARLRAPRVRHKMGFGSCDNGGLLLQGRFVRAVRAVGKHLLIEFEGSVVLRTHLGMYGSWHRYQPGEPWNKPEYQATVILRTDLDVFVCFNAMEIEVLGASGIRGSELSRRLGPDRLGEVVDFEEVAKRARSVLEPHAPVMDMLLDQRIACGIGNVYKSEVLFIERQSPFASVSHVDDGVLVRLYRTARELLQRNLGGGRRVTRFANDGAGQLWVYGRIDKPCFSCESRIHYSRAGRGLRSTYWCPKCQAR